MEGEGKEEGVEGQWCPAVCAFVCVTLTPCHKWSWPVTEGGGGGGGGGDIKTWVAGHWCTAMCACVSVCHFDSMR